jgi:protein-S-isoprenylcysteine O-methyltransferase Ste14
MHVPNLGARGGGWVVGQFAALTVIAATALWGFGTGPPPTALVVVGGALVLVGVALAVWAAAALGGALVPWPAPVGDAVVRRGPYARVRHPIYSGGLLMCLGIATATTWWALLPTGFLAVWWALKCRVEERMLARRFNAYANYCAAVRWRLVPLVY